MLGLGVATGAVVLGGVLLGASAPPKADAGLLIGTSGNDVLIGKDDDVQENPVIQPPGTAADQSLARADVLLGLEGDDLLIGLLGDDYLDGGPGDDVLVGGTEQGNRPNSDIQLGGEGDDVAVWAGGDGSDAYVGGPGNDAIVFAVIDRDEANVPTAKQVEAGRGTRPIVTANLTGAPGFCTVEAGPEGSGYEFLVRFIRRTDDVLLVTVRVTHVEQVFCASREGGGAEWADLTAYTYGGAIEMRPITLERITERNPLAGAIVR